MKTTYKKIAYTCTTLNREEIPQRIAFSHGYKWTAAGVVVQKTYGMTLLFDPNNKTIDLLLPKGTTVPQEYIPTYGLIDLNKELSCPVVDATNVNHENGIHSATVFENQITFRSTTSRLVGTVTVPKDFIKKVLRSDVGLQKDGLPVVSFHYPDSSLLATSLLRFVRVTRFDTKYLQGFETSRGGCHSDEKGVFKKYDVTKLRDLRLEEFIQE
jgi:hypothetical protein